MKHGSLFSGIRVFDLAADILKWENIFSCEIDDWCNKIGKERFPNTRIYNDIKEFDAREYEKRIDVLSGGFPCQDISVSGKGEGITGERSGLWSEYDRIIKEVSPRYVVIENSPQLLRKGFEKVLHDLSKSGYDAEWQTISAADFGKPHLRERLWVVAYPTTQRRRGILHMLKRSIIEKNKKTNPLDTSCHPFLRFEQRFGEPPVFRVDDGSAKRLDVVKRLGGCGNAVVLDLVIEIFKAIEAFEKAA